MQVAWHASIVSGNHCRMLLLALAVVFLDWIDIWGYKDTLPYLVRWVRYWATIAHQIEFVSVVGGRLVWLIGCLN